MKSKKKKQLSDIKARRKWAMNPVQRIHSSRRKPEINWKKDYKGETDQD